MIEFACVAEAAGGQVAAIPLLGSAMALSALLSVAAYLTGMESRREGLFAALFAFSKIGIGLALTSWAVVNMTRRPALAIAAAAAIGEARPDWWRMSGALR